MENSVSDIPAGDGKTANLCLQCSNVHPWIVLCASPPINWHRLPDPVKNLPKVTYMRFQWSVWSKYNKTLWWDWTNINQRLNKSYKKVDSRVLREAGVCPGWLETSVHSYNRFLPQNRGLIRCWEWTKHLLSLRATLVLVLKKFPPVLCFVHQVDAKFPVFRGCTQKYRRTEPVLNRAEAQTPWQN